MVYQNGGGAPGERAGFGRLLRSLHSELAAAGGEAEIGVVSFGAGVRLFQLARDARESAVGPHRLRAAGGRSLACRDTPAGLHLARADLCRAPPGDVAPSGVADTARPQGRGHVYERP